MIIKKVYNTYMNAYLNGKIIPIHDPCKNKHLRKGDIQLIGMDHRCITTHLKMQLINYLFKKKTQFFVLIIDTKLGKNADQ